MALFLKLDADGGNCFKEIPVNESFIGCACYEQPRGPSWPFAPASLCTYEQIKRDKYNFCLGGFSEGFEFCFNDLTKVGERIPCVREKDMQAILSYTGGFAAVGATVGGVVGAGFGAAYGGVGAIPGWEAGASAGMVAGGAIGMAYGYFAYDNCTFVTCKPSTDANLKTSIDRPARTASGGYCRSK